MDPLLELSYEIRTMIYNHYFERVRLKIQTRPKYRTKVDIDPVSGRQRSRNFIVRLALPRCLAIFSVSRQLRRDPRLYDALMRNVVFVVENEDDFERIKSNKFLESFEQLEQPSVARLYLDSDFYWGQPGLHAMLKVLPATFSRLKEVKFPTLSTAYFRHDPENNDSFADREVQVRDGTGRFVRREDKVRDSQGIGEMLIEHVRDRSTSVAEILDQGKIALVLEFNVVWFPEGMPREVIRSAEFDTRDWTVRIQSESGVCPLHQRGNSTYNPPEQKDA